MKLPTLYAVVCGNGRIYCDGGGIAVSARRDDAEECLEGINQSGGMCPDDHDHRIVCYVPIVSKKKKAKS